MVDALGGALPGELVMLAQKGRQLERLEVMDEQKLGRVGHDATLLSCSSWDFIGQWVPGDRSAPPVG